MSIRIAAQVDSRIDDTLNRVVASPVIALWSQVRKAHRRSVRCGHVGNPRRGYPSPVRTGRHVHHPNRRASGSRRCHALQFEQIGEQDDRLAVRTTASKPDRACVQIAVSATALAEETLATPRTLVHGMRHQQPPTLEFPAQQGRIDGAVQRSSAQTIGQLLACRCAVDRATARWRATARRAGT